MTISVGATNSGFIGFNTSATTGTFTSTGGANSTFIIGAVFDNGKFLSVGDNKGNTYSQVGTEQIVPSASGNSIRFYKKEGGTGGAGHTATVNASGNAGIVVMFLELLGVGAEDTVGAQSGTDSSSPFSAPSYTPAATDHIVVIVEGDNSTSASDTHADGASFAISVDFSAASSAWGGCIATRIVTPASGSYTGSITGSGATTAALIISSWPAASPPPAAFIGTYDVDPRVKKKTGGMNWGLTSPEWW